MLKVSYRPNQSKKNLFSQDVFAKRCKQGLTQEQMAEYLFVSVNAYKKIEAGHIPKTGFLLLICAKLGLEPMDYLEEALKQEKRDVLLQVQETETV